MGLIKISEGILDGKVHTITYSMPNTTFPKRDTTLEKRADKNIEGGRCMTMCTENKDVAARPQPNDCTVLYNELYSQAVQFSVDSSTSPSLSQDYTTKLTNARLDFGTQSK